MTVERRRAEAEAAAAATQLAAAREEELRWRAAAAAATARAERAEKARGDALGESAEEVAAWRARAVEAEAAAAEARRGEAEAEAATRDAQLAVGVPLAHAQAELLRLHGSLRLLARALRPLRVRCHELCAQKAWLRAEVRRESLKAGAAAVQLRLRCDAEERVAAQLHCLLCTLSASPPPREPARTATLAAPSRRSPRVRWVVRV